MIKHWFRVASDEVFQRLVGEMTEARAIVEDMSFVDNNRIRIMMRRWTHNNKVLTYELSRFPTGDIYEVCTRTETVTGDDNFYPAPCHVDEYRRRHFGEFKSIDKRYRKAPWLMLFGERFFPEDECLDLRDPAVIAAMDVQFKHSLMLDSDDEREAAFLNQELSRYDWSDDHADENSDL